MTTEKQMLPETAVFGALWRYKGLILVFTILAGGAGYFFAERATPQYAAEASLLLRFDREYSPRNLASDSWHGEPIRVTLDGALNNELEILGSRRLLEETLAQVGPAPVVQSALAPQEPLTQEQQLEQIRQALSLRRVEGTSIAKLSFTHADPGYATAFLATLVETHISTRAPLLNWSPSESLREVKDWTEARMIEAQANLAEFRAQSGTFDAESIRADLLSRRTGLRLDLMRLASDAPGGAQADIEARISAIDAELADLTQIEYRLEALTSESEFAAEQFRNARDIFAQQELSERLAAAHGPSIILLDHPATGSQPVGLTAVATAVLSGALGFGLACLLALWLGRYSFGTRARSTEVPAPSAPLNAFIAPRLAPGHTSRPNTAKISSGR